MLTFSGDIGFHLPRNVILPSLAFLHFVLHCLRLEAHLFLLHGLCSVSYGTYSLLLVQLSEHKVHLSLFCFLFDHVILMLEFLVLLLHKLVLVVKGKFLFQGLLFRDGLIRVQIVEVSCW